MTFDEIVKEYEDNVANLTRSELTLLRAVYEAGLRRAQKLAKEHCRVEFKTPSGVVPSIDWISYDQAIDAEVSER